MSLIAGAAQRDISPRKPLFLVGYPHIPRTSTGIHDPLLATALSLDDGRTQLLLISVDNLFAPREVAQACRAAICEATGIPESNILISPTHTHSAPVTATQIAWRNDPVVPPPDLEYMERFTRGIIEAALAAHASAEPARLAIAIARADGVGTNRLDPSGPFDPEVRLLVVERDRQLLALDLIYGMHPTVLHEDSTLASGDFPAFTRQHLVEQFPGLTTIYHMGACGNLSPRYHVRAQTFAEAERLGRRLGATVAVALRTAEFRDDTTLAAASRSVELPARRFPPASEARLALQQARETFDRLRREGAPHGPVRTAECAVFGAEEAVALAEAQASGELAAAQSKISPVEVLVFRIGDTFIVGWPCEIFVEYSLELKRRVDGPVSVITLANGELQGYIVTPEAAAAGGYEAAFSLFEPASGARLVDASVALIKELSS